MATLHQKLAVVIVLVALFGTIWAAYATYKKHSIRRLLTVSGAVTAVLALQGLMGTILGLTGNRPAEPSHFVFGPLTLLALPVAILTARHRTGRAGAGILLLGWLVTLGLSLRAVGTGGLTS